MLKRKGKSPVAVKPHKRSKPDGRVGPKVFSVEGYARGKPRRGR